MKNDAIDKPIIMNIPINVASNSVKIGGSSQAQE